MNGRRETDTLRMQNQLLVELFKHSEEDSDGHKRYMKYVALRINSHADNQQGLHVKAVDNIALVARAQKVRFNDKANITHYYE